MDGTQNKKKTILLILLFCLLVSLMAFIGPVLGGSPSNPGLGFVIWGAAPLLAAILIRIFAWDWSDSGFKPGIKRNTGWYILSILAFPVLTLLSFFAGEIASVSSFSGFSAPAFLKTFLTALPVFFIFAIFEEVGWRGFLVPKLDSAGTNSYLSAAIVSAVWSTWHLPYIKQLAWVYSSEKLMLFIPRFYLAMFAFAIMYNEIRIITGSVWPAVIMHCVMNSFGHPLAADYVGIVPGYEYLVSSTGVFMIVFVGLLGIILNRYRMRKALSPIHITTE